MDLFFSLLQFLALFVLISAQNVTTITDMDLGNGTTLQPNDVVGMNSTDSLSFGTVLPTNATNPSTTATSPVSAATTSTTSSTKCSFNPCYNGGMCEVTDQGYVCQCPTGYTGVVCQLVATTTPPPATTGVIHECEFNPCYNGGFCLRVGDGYRCVCVPGYTGHVCESESTTVTDSMTSTHVPTVTSTTVPTVTSTTVPTVTTTVATTPACTDNHLKLSNIGCAPMEVVFMIEYGKTEDRKAVDDEGDFVKDLTQRWSHSVNSGQVRVAVVMYHDTVTEAIHLDQFKGGRRNVVQQLDTRISSLTRQVRPSGDADLAGALDFVRTQSFQPARDGVARVVIPIVHQLPPSDTNDQLIQSAQQLKDTCTKIMPLYVYGNPHNSTLIHAIASQPYNDYYRSYPSHNFDDLEDDHSFARC